MWKLLKICWIRKDIKDYDWIDFLGFNFIDISKRKISPENAKNIITPKTVMRVWLFWKYQDESWQNLDINYLDEIIKIAHETGMKWLQIYWKCDFKYLKSKWFYIIQALSYKDIAFLEEDENINLYIIDWPKAWSWKWYDYEILKTLSLKKPFLIAWWIKENNLKEVLQKVPNAIWIDIASWVDNGKNVCRRRTQRIVKIMEEINS